MQKDNVLADNKPNIEIMRLPIEGYTYQWRSTKIRFKVLAVGWHHKNYVYIVLLGGDLRRYSIKSWSYIQPQVELVKHGWLPPIGERGAGTFAGDLRRVIVEDQHVIRLEVVHAKSK